MTRETAGQPPHEPTEETRRRVRTLSGYGVRHEIICHDIQVSLPTLYKYYREDLDTGDSQAQGLIGQSMFDRGVKDKDTGALIWLTKTRMGWKDISRVETDHTSSDGSMSPKHGMTLEEIDERIAHLQAVADAAKGE